MAAIPVPPIVWALKKKVDDQEKRLIELERILGNSAKEN